MVGRSGTVSSVFVAMTALVILHAGAASAQGIREAEIEFARGQLLLDMKDHPRAVFSFAKAYSIQPDNRYLAGLVVACEGDGQMERALVLGEDYLARESDRPDPRVVDVVSRLRTEYAAGRGKVAFAVTPPGGTLVLYSHEGSRETVNLEDSRGVRWLRRGSWSAKYERDGYEPVSVAFDVTSGEPLDLTFAATRMEGDADLVVTSNVAAARVFIDGQEVGKTPLKARIPSGDHVVQVWAEDHVAWSGVVDALVGSGVTVQANLVRSMEPVRSIPVQTMDVRRRRALSLAGWGWITMGAGVAMGGGAGYFYYVMFDKATEAQDLPAGDPRRTELSQQVQTNWLSAVILGSVGGAMIGGGLLMVLLDKGDKGEESTPFELLTLTPSSDGRGAFLDAAWTF